MERDHDDANFQANGMERTFELNETHYSFGHMQKGDTFLITRHLSHKLEE